MLKRKRFGWWLAEMCAAAIAGPIVFIVIDLLFPFIRNQLVIIPGVIVGSLLILCATRWLNRRDSQRHVGFRMPVWQWVAAATCILILLAMIAPAIQKAALSH